MKNLLERIKPEHLHTLLNSETFDGDPNVFLSDFDTLGEMTGLELVKLADGLEVGLDDLGGCFNVEVLEINDRQDIDHSDNTSMQIVEIDATIDLGFKTYTLIASAVAVMEFTMIEGSIDVPEDGTSKFLELQDVEIQMYHLDKSPVICADFDQEDIERVLIDHCVNN